MGSTIDWPDPRFENNSDGTVTDNLTGLMWAEDASAGPMLWSSALTYCNQLELGEYTDWRLPNVKELQSLIDYGNANSCLSTNHPFSGVVSNYYWSSTTYANNTYLAWNVCLDYGYVNYGNKDRYNYVWPVRGGE